MSQPLRLLPGAWREGGTEGRSALRVTAALLASVVAVIDHVTGSELGFFVFYFLPILLLAWGDERSASIIAAGACAALWLAVEWTAGRPYSSYLFLIWNALIRLVAFVAFAAVLSRLRAVFDREKLLTASLQQTLDEIRELKGLLPICASCKSIRNDDGYWETIEQYVRAHSKADFSHGICPECFQKLYPEIHARKVAREAADAPVAADLRGLPVPPRT